MKHITRTTALAGVALLALTACGESGENDQEASSGPATVETTSEDPFEDIPDDAPIHDMDEDDIAQHMLGCDDGLSAEECQQQYESGIEAESIERSIEECQEYIEAAAGGGWAVGSCSNYTMTNTEFYQVFEERTGKPVPEELQEPNPTCEELVDELSEAVSDHNSDPQSASAELAVERAEGRIEMHDCQDAPAASQQAPDESTEPYSASFPNADEVDFYGPISHPDELMVDINTIEDCETAGIIQGGLMNGELEGFDIDHQYLGLLENWMQGSGCFAY